MSGDHGTGSDAHAAANLGAAHALLLALRQLGLRRLVLCPGSRSAPLAIAAGLLEAEGEGLQLYTAIDERSAAFFALGLSRADGRPAAVITTSGTAVANLLPAAVEADHGAIPLLLLSADRPQRLKGRGANQTVNQEDFLRCSCRWAGAGADAGLAVMTPASLQALAQRAWQAANGRPAGPVHLNLAFEEPLHPSAVAIAALVARTPSTRAVVVQPEPLALSEPPPLLDPDRPGVIVAGPWRGAPDQWTAHLQALQRWQRRSGWPLLADGLSGLRGQPLLELVAGYDLLLEQPTEQLQVSQLLRLGPLPASRRLQHWIGRQRGRQLVISEGDPRDLDPLGSASQRCGQGLAAWCRALPAQLWAGEPPAANLAWQRRLTALEQAVQAGLSQALPATGSANEPAIARALSLLLPPQLPVMLASSSPVRDWESFAAPAGPPRALFGFRGASGIDGTLSLAAGLAESAGALVLLSGDLALLHDSNGWLWRQQLRGRLTVVLIDNGGGGIFEQLPIRSSGALPVPPEVAAPFDFERLFAMPQSLDQGALAVLHGVPVRRVAQLEELEAALAWALPQPLALLELRTDRHLDARLRRQLRATLAPGSKE